jgi:hypothetical protein
MRHYASTLLLSRPLSAAGLDAPPGDSLGQLARREFESTRRRWVKLLTLLAWLPAIAGAQHRDRVDVGGYRLDVLRSGSGDPAVVFETGLADSLDTWAPIWPAIARSATAIAYSRAGFGRSDAGTADHSARREVLDLHSLLHRLPAPPPYVLVGRSYGGLLVRL